ncbi:MAG TPA: hypothetical protein VFH56_04410 [Acidimicrobiales bacterium]|nr:hypothetical protein [Acidimicrobiales bacterium]
MTAAHAQKIRPITRPIAAFVEVTPRLAEEWLAGNTVNRKVRPDAVNQYAADMIAGRWTISESAICFSPDGELLNGQHRLRAVIQSGATICMLVMRNVPIESMSNMDAGRKRTTADALGFDGESSPHLLAAATKLALLYTDGRLYRDRKVQSVSTGELRDFLAAHPDLRYSIFSVSTVARPVDLTPTAKVVAHWIFTHAVSEDVADEFFELLSTRVGLPEGSPILALDSRIRELRRSKSRINHRSELHLLIKAWNHWRAGRAVRSLTLPNKAADAQLPAVAR